MSEKQNIEEIIIRYFRQDVTEDDVRLLDAWLEERPENKALFFELKALDDYSHKSPLLRESVKETGWQKMKARILESEKETVRSETPKEPVTQWRKWLIILKYASIIILAISAGWGISEFSRNPASSSPAKDIVYNEIYVEKGGRANTVILSDGTKVVLNAATRLRYPTSFNGKDRKVYLDGEAYFEVTKNEDKPFIVKLKKQDITVLGTSFNVEAYEAENYSIVSLLSGRIALDAFNESGEPMSRMFLKPDQKAYSDNQSGSVSIQNIEASLSSAWVYGMYKFKDEPLSAIFKRLENYYGVKIHLSSDKLKQVKYTGSFSLDQDIREVLRIIDYEKQLHVKFAGKDIFIASK